MGLSAELRREILELEEHKDDFRYTDGGLSDKSVMMLLGGTGFGKSHVLRKMTALRPFPLHIREVGTKTTRARKQGEKGDPKYYRTADEDVTHESFVSDIRAGKMVNWSYIHKTGHLYGSDKKSFEADITLAPTLPSSVEQIRKAGFKAVHTVYILPDVNDWEAAFHDQIEQRDPGFYARLDEARQSIEYAMDPPRGVNILRVVNRHDEVSLRRLAQGLLRICEKPHDSMHRLEVAQQFSPGFEAQASAMRSRISELLWEHAED